MNDIHFISGLPRAGSTLLSALLRQNPKFRAGMTGPVGTLVESMLRAMSMANESSIYIDDRQRETLLRKIFETFHGELPSDHVSFDTNRLWCSKLALLEKLYPRAKVICCVRDVAAIVNSIERLVMENALQPSGILGLTPVVRFTHAPTASVAAVGWSASPGTHFARGTSGRTPNDFCS